AIPGRRVYGRRKRPSADGYPAGGCMDGGEGLQPTDTRPAGGAAAEAPGRHASPVDGPAGWVSREGAVTGLHRLRGYTRKPMMKFISRLVDSNDREVRRLEPLVERINALEPEYEAMSDADLRGTTATLRATLQDR